VSSVETNRGAASLEAAGKPRLGCDQFVGSEPLYVHNALQLTGWATADGGIGAVEVEIGDRKVPASYGHPSPDLADSLADGAYARFELRLDPLDLMRGEHAIVIRARSRRGEIAEVCGTLHVEPYAPAAWQPEDERTALESGRPTMTCEVDASANTPLGLPQYLYGWAYASAGISRISVFIGGTHRYEAEVGLPRIDLVRGLGLCLADAGFRLLLEPDRVPPGRQAVVVVAYPLEGEPVGTSGWLDFTTSKNGLNARLDEAELESSENGFVPDRHRDISAEEKKARHARSALAPLRAGEWWEHKLAPMLATGYMTAFYLRSSLLRLGPTFVAALVGMAAAAAYVSLINDLSDLEADAVSGKNNRLAQRGRPFAYASVAGALAIGLAVAVFAWRNDLLALALYTGPWLAFSLYSLPPIRLKARGCAGALADASGAHLFPQLLIAVAVFHAADRRLNGAWLAAVGIWALAAGMRGALWHQLRDVDADRRSGVKTFARLHPVRARLAGQAVLPVELAAFVFLLWRAGSPVPFALLVGYVLLEWGRTRLWGVRLIVVSSPTQLSRMAMHEYYVCFYPLAFLAASALRRPADIVVLVLHAAIMFRFVALGVARDSTNALTRLLGALRTSPACSGEAPTTPPWVDVTSSRSTGRASRVRELSHACSATDLPSESFDLHRSSSQRASVLALPLKVEAGHAVAAGLRFLRAVQQADGSLPSATWRMAGDREFHLGPERAVFQTAFIGSVLLGVPGAEAIVGRVTQFVEAHREPESVWRYLTKDDPRFDSLAPDVDDTALSALLLRAAGQSVGAAEAVLVSNRDRAGRFYTWITVLGGCWRSPGRLRILIRRRSHRRLVHAGFKYQHQRIRDIDAGVNANVVLHLGRRPGTERAVAYLLDVARRGATADRWYQDPLTLWYLISRALHRHGINAGDVLLERLASCRPTTSLQLAQAVCIALDWGGGVPETWIAGLLASQSPGGGWERIAIYSVADERWGGEATTTALCVEALARWLANGLDAA
jgi:4-hydroxybenzoate polyprenyltransferase